jgi:ubiquinone biosynthesis monooxygenase Coq7
MSLPGKFPGDTSDKTILARMIRVDHAGEYGARRIYQGQLAVLGKTEHGDVLRHMQAQEEAHLQKFSALIAERNVRPTALLPLWHIAGFVLGAATAALGPKAAMACTVAVEEAIDRHYRAQTATLAGGAETALHDTIENFRAEELEHRDLALARGAAGSKTYPLLRALIGAGCKAAIALSERI